MSMVTEPFAGGAARILFGGSGRPAVTLDCQRSGLKASGRLHLNEQACHVGDHCQIRCSLAKRIS